MEKIAITSEGPTLDDRIDPRFGRAACFLIVDPETEEVTSLDNGSTQTLAQGAGIQSAEIVSRSGASVVLTGFVGPKAFQALYAAGIRVGQNLENMTAREALEKYRKGEVDIASQPNKQRGHW